MSKIMSESEMEQFLLNKGYSIHSIVDIVNAACLEGYNNSIDNEAGTITFKMKSNKLICLQCHTAIDDERVVTCPNCGYSDVVYSTDLIY